MLVSSLVITLALYAAGVRRLWCNAGRGRGVRTVEVVAFACGWLALLMALSAPLDEWSEQSQAAHMVQHELLMVIAAPLVAAGAPMIGLPWAMPSRWRIQ